MDLAKLKADLRMAEAPGAVAMLFPYRDTVGKTTIGFGRNLTDVGITAEDAERWLSEDVARAMDALRAKLPWVVDIGEVRQRALTELCFNLGIGNAKRGLLSFYATLAHMEAGRWEQAARGLERSLWARQVGPTRSDRIAHMIRHGEDPA